MIKGYSSLKADNAITSFFAFQVDKHIRKLDFDLARFEADLKEQHEQEIAASEYEEGTTALKCDLANTGANSSQISNDHELQFTHSVLFILASAG